MSVLSARMRRLFKTTGLTLRTYAEFCRAMWLRGMKSAAKQSYTRTVLLPQTNFPVRLGGRKRVEMDSYLIEKCGFLELYNWQRKHLEGPDFILHDGPPYANGEPHMGHAINKVLKDITLRSKIITGRRVHYVPGWDCHGLPIEQKVLSDIKDIKDKPLEIRRKAGKYASDAIAKQRQAFTSWGIMADWNESGCYFTNHVSYVKNQMQQFTNLYDKGLVYRAFKPVHWSPSSKTALAESELEYNESHESKSAIVRMQLDTHALPSRLKDLETRPLYALIWTTTPWSLIANQAIAFSSNIVYCIVEDSSKNLYILAQECLANIEQKLGLLKIVTTIMGQELGEAKYLHPITKQRLPFLSGHHVTTNIGTGLVHTAPAHGAEDFLVAIENNISVLSLIDDDGCFTKEAGDEFSGLDVLNDGTNKILQRIGEDVLHADIITHSYPYDWRTKKPVIIRASHQWFIDINSIKEKAIDSIANIRIYPKHNQTSYLNALIAHVKQRSYWCISRQRSWGTPIPVLLNKRTGDTYTSRKWVERLCRLMERHGTDYWWELSTEKLIGRDLRQELNVDDFERGTDIMDIWLDSGLSWSAVLPEHKADLYLEGMDQFRGWFQASLLTSIALQERSPYSAIFVHGFAVDDKTSKMSKSVGNVINPEIIIKGGENLNKNPAYGVDTLRWWVASHGCQHTHVPVTTALLSESHEAVQKLRSVLRFLLGILHPYSEGITVEPEYLYLDKYMLHALHQYNKEIQNLYDNYLYHHASKLITNFLATTVSPVYCHLTKDRLYCDEAASPTRLAAVEVTRETLTVLARSIAPIVPHLAEEVWLYHPENLASVPLYHTECKVPETWHQSEIARHVETALSLRGKVNTLADRNTWEMSGILKASKDDYESLSILQKDRESSTSELCDILQLSSVTLIESPTVTGTEVELHNIEKMLCQRCRRHPELDKNGLCGRCIKVLDVANVSSVSV